MLLNNLSGGQVEDLGGDQFVKHVVRTIVPLSHHHLPRHPMQTPKLSKQHTNQISGIKLHMMKNNGQCIHVFILDLIFLIDNKIVQYFLGWMEIYFCVVIDQCKEKC